MCVSAAWWWGLKIMISLFVPSKTAPIETERTLGKYGALLNSFHPEIKRHTKT